MPPKQQVRESDIKRWIKMYQVDRLTLMQIEIRDGTFSAQTIGNHLQKRIELRPVGTVTRPGFYPSDEDIERWKALRAQGLTYSAIADEVGRSPATIRRYTQGKAKHRRLKVLSGN